MSHAAATVSSESSSRHRPMIQICEDAAQWLDATWNDERALFPYSTRVVEGGYANDYGPLAGALRYSITSFAGLARMAAAEPGHPLASAVPLRLNSFLEKRLGDVKNFGDLGLLLAVCSEDAARHDAAEVMLATVAERAGAAHPRSATMQELAWMLWGLCAARRAGLSNAAADAAAWRLYAFMEGRQVDPESLMPHHNRQHYRRAILSFGALVYYARALAEFATAFGDARVHRRFDETVERIVALQGPLGEWPWMIDARKGITLDRYPVFGVHQDSMAMLFLLPALDRGLDVRDAILRSYRWIEGENELSVQMFEREPFNAFRAIELDMPLPRMSRYTRSLLRSAVGRASGDVPSERLRINRECRSYHLGWRLYVWSGRADAARLLHGADNAAEPDQTPVYASA